MKTFKLRAQGSKKYFTVIVYDKLQDMRNAAIKHDKEAGSKELDYDKTFGVSHMYQRIIMRDKKEIPHDEIGIIRFSKKHMPTRVVLHEAMHAALWQYRLSSPSRTADFGEQCSPEEEEFIHLAQKLFTDIIKKMYKHKYWK